MRIKTHLFMFQLLRNKNAWNFDGQIDIQIATTNDDH